MLVLSRKIGQEIVVGDTIRITITKVSGNRVTLGVQAPEQVRILRGELCPFASAFEKEQEDEEEEVPDVLSHKPLAHKVGMEDVADTIPFLPTAAR